MSSNDLIRAYPEQARERDRWILSRRSQRNSVDPQRPHAFLIEEERAESGEIVSVATLFLTNRECPWRCLMCDLWKNTLMETVPVGAIPAQIDYALAQHVDADVSSQHIARESSRVFTNAATRQIKLYNSGSFFDPRAIPPEDYVAIASRVRAFERVIVECHPALVGDSALEFRDLLKTNNAREASPPVHRPTPGPSQEGNSVKALAGRLYSPSGDGTGFAGAISEPSSMESSEVVGRSTKLEVAMGLETAHPQVLDKLNKRMTLDQFRRAAEFLRENDIALRVFVLVKPPFLDETEALQWAKRSMDFAFDCGATVVSLIPTRLGNGALDALAERGEFSPPKLATLETAMEYGIGSKRARVFADLWDLERFSDCNRCFERRRAWLSEMNLRQIIQPQLECECCRGSKR
jgi:uncharacterized Fe-S cluster-containing MiaB family protein